MMELLNDGGYVTRKAEWTTNLSYIMCEWELSFVFDHRPVFLELAALKHQRLLFF